MGCIIEKKKKKNVKINIEIFSIFFIKLGKLFRQFYNSYLLIITKQTKNIRNVYWVVISQNIYVHVITLHWFHEFTKTDWNVLRVVSLYM